MTFITVSAYYENVLLTGLGILSESDKSTRLSMSEALRIGMLVTRIQDI